MRPRQLEIIFALSLAVSAPAGNAAETADTLIWQVTATGSGSTGRFAPYLIGSDSGGRHAMKSMAGIDLSVTKDFNLDKRFSWTAGAELSAGYESSATYGLYDADSETWTRRDWHPSRAIVRQLWGGVKFRGVMLWAGMRDHTSPLVDDRLSSGDMTLSNNARAIPQVEIGFIDYQDIPFTKGWVRISGALSYGKYTDSDALADRYNYYTNHITKGQLFTYKRVHFRTREDRPLSITVGVQSAGEFGGTTYHYTSGKPSHPIKNPSNLKAFWEMFIPGLRHSDGFVEGNHIGTWDFKGRYRLPSNIDLEGYFQWFWEDGSGMAKRNCTDGLWGFAITLPGENRVFKKGLIEYIDMRDQSGPIHWAPSDAPGTTITTEATGGDNYYNSTTFNAWANYGLGLGSSFPVAPLYNADGNPQFLYCRTRGFQAAVTGSFGPAVDWTAKFSHAVAWGTGRIPSKHALKNTSALVSATWNVKSLLPGLRVSGALAFDAGKLRGNNFGGILTVSYSGNFNFD